ncbi:MAG: hypothetical protein H7096_10295 [Flavobacterium sp.]|nr:hypothetical protein [Pedobacter sp.]
MDFFPPPDTNLPENSLFARKLKIFTWHMNKAIFIDKDGTLVPDVLFNINPDLITLKRKV